jgi:hypothetical protein
MAWWCVHWHSFLCLCAIFLLARKKPWNADLVNVKCKNATMVRPQVGRARSAISAGSEHLAMADDRCHSPSPLGPLWVQAVRKLARSICE